ncbi:MAG TPA: NifU N-terminal domain-containing protein [Anaerolineae bacterium]|nr:NifU N-terminal domain-containing protein [Anaerolineae bacterium]
MSEYMEIEPEISDEDPLIAHIYTNLPLTNDGPEQYASPDEMAEGSPVAQALSVVDGLQALHIDGEDMTLTRDPDLEWHIILAEVTAVLKDFFL